MRWVRGTQGHFEATDRWFEASEPGQSPVRADTLPLATGASCLARTKPLGTSVAPQHTRVSARASPANHYRGGGGGVFPVWENPNLQILARQIPCHFSKMREQIVQGWQKLLMRNSGRLLLFPRRSSWFINQHSCLNFLCAICSVFARDLHELGYAFAHLYHARGCGL